MCNAPPLPTLEIPPNSYATVPGILRPASRGELKLVAGDPTAPPYLDPCYLREEADLNALVHSLEALIEIMESPSFAKWRKRAVWPSAKTRAERVQWVRQTCETYHHQAGTCKMGIDAMSVVDPQIAGLWRRRSARRRRLDHARCDQRQHQCRFDHDRREGGRPDPRSESAGDAPSLNEGARSRRE
jgi:hypothetical protein